MELYHSTMKPRSISYECMIFATKILHACSLLRQRQIKHRGAVQFSVQIQTGDLNVILLQNGLLGLKCKRILELG